MIKQNWIHNKLMRFIYFKHLKSIPKRIQNRWGIKYMNNPMMLYFLTFLLHFTILFIEIAIWINNYVCSWMWVSDWRGYAMGKKFSDSYIFGESWFLNVITLTTVGYGNDFVIKNKTNDAFNDLFILLLIVSPT